MEPSGNTGKKLLVERNQLAERQMPVQQGDGELTLNDSQCFAILIMRAVFGSPQLLEAT